VSLLLGKAAANVVLGLAIVLASLAGCAIVLAIEGRVPFSLGPFALVWGLLLVPTFLLWTTFVCASFAVSGNRIATYVIGLGAMSLTGWFQARGKMNWVFNWDLWSTVRWSDISVFELDRTALVLNRVLAVGLAAFFIVLTTRAFTRRESDATRTIHRLRPAALGREALALAPWLVVPLVCAIWLGTLVHSGRDGGWAVKQRRDYWNKNVETWKNSRCPSLAAADFDLDVDPARGWLRSKGSYVLLNRTDDTLRRFPITGGLQWKHVKWSMNGKDYKPEDHARLYVFTPPAPLAPGDRVTVGFEFDGTTPVGTSKNGGGSMEFVLPSSVVLTGFDSPSFAPQLGYYPDVGVERDRNRADPRDYPDDYWRRTLPAELPMFDGWCDTHFRLTGPANLQHNATGTLVSEKVAGGKRVTEWRSDAPVRAFNVVMGRWQVKRREGVAVYYDARHPYNVDEMLDALSAARKWYGAWFAPYPYRELRVSEFPNLAGYAQGSPNNITFSEGIGYLTKSEPRSNAAFWVTAHEAAHQWWPCMAMPGMGPGGDVLSEGMAHFSTILLTEQVRGERQRMAFCRQIEDQYANSRQRDSERPLTKIDGSLPGDSRIIYDRGGWVFWMVYDYLGHERAMAAYREFFRSWSQSRDHPALQDFVAAMRPYAADPAAFDAFAAQWFEQKVVPQYVVESARKTKNGDGWDVQVRVKNVGTGTMPVELAATAGERWTKPKKAADISTQDPSYREARALVTLGAGESQEATLHCSFEPQQVVVDPDVRILQLKRKQAVATL
jgi:ABC-2 type transport system permease protein